MSQCYVCLRDTYVLRIYHAKRLFTNRKFCGFSSMIDNNQILRILDANCNRASEALRTIEEFFRFIWNDSCLTKLTKDLRHELTQALTVSGDKLIAMRDTSGDVGTSISTPTESNRDSATDVLRAAFSRLQEALRVIEEYGKVQCDLVSSSAIEQLRYRSYQLQHSFTSVSFGCERLTGARIYALVSGCHSMTEFVEFCSNVIRAGVDVIQFRDKQLSDRDLVERGKQLRMLCSAADSVPLLIMNDRPDLAVLIGADGVHIGQDELSVAEARTIIGPDRVVGVSTHNIEQVETAVRDGANYIGCGPTFPSGTKSFDEFAGVSFLRQVSGSYQIPAFAIGGIDLQNISEVVDAGFTRIAISGVLSNGDPCEVVSALQPLLT